MIRVVYTSRFTRHYKKLPIGLQEEVKNAITRFMAEPHNPLLKTHRLKGELKGYSSFSVNYRYRIVFEWDDKKTAALLAVGDHSVYD